MAHVVIVAVWAVLIRLLVHGEILRGEKIVSQYSSGACTGTGWTSLTCREAYSHLAECLLARLADQHQLSRLGQPMRLRLGVAFGALENAIPCKYKFFPFPTRWIVSRAPTSNHF